MPGGKNSWTTSGVRSYFISFRPRQRLGRAAHPSDVVDSHDDRPLFYLRIIQSRLNSSSNFRVGLSERRNVNETFGATCNRMILRYAANSSTEASSTYVMLSSAWDLKRQLTWHGVILFMDRKLVVSKHASHVSSSSTGSSSSERPRSWGMVYDAPADLCTSPAVDSPNISSTCLGVSCGCPAAWTEHTLEAIVDNLGRFDDLCTAGVRIWQWTAVS